MEQSTTIKKKLKDDLNPYQFALSISLGIAIFSAIIVIIFKEFKVEWTTVSIALFIFQIVAGFFYYPIANRAIHYAEISVFYLLGCMNLPILLVSDLVLGYSITPLEIVGIGIIFISLWYGLYKRDLSFKGIRDIVLSNIILMGMMIAFKYVTHHYTTPETANFIIHAPLVLLFIPIVLKTAGIKWLKKTFKTKYRGLSWLYGMGNVCIAEAYKSITPAIVMLFKQAFMMIFSLITGRLIFHERKTVKKIWVAAGIIIGIIVMLVGR